MFQSIEDVQKEEDEDFYNEPLSSRPSAFNSAMGFNRETKNKATFARQSKTQLGNIRPELLKSDLSQAAVTPRLQ
jgi:hypothetical protein